MGYKKIGQFLKLSFRSKLLLFEAIVMLFFSKMLVLFFSFKRLTPYIGKLHGDYRTVLSVHETNKAQNIKLSIIIARNNVPWQTVCLDQAIATVLMLKKRKIPNSLFLGVKKNEKLEKIDAHAWVMCGGKILIGGNRSKSYSTTAYFSNEFSKRVGLK